MEEIKEVGSGCSLLRTFKLIYREAFIYDDEDEEAFASVKTIPQLRHLQIIGNSLTDAGLKAVLDGCPHLESLDLRSCPRIHISGNLGKICSEGIKCLWPPLESSDDCKFVDLAEYDMSDYDDYQYGHDEYCSHNKHALCDGGLYCDCYGGLGEKNSRLEI
ncbi:hypothetical protein Droror1_Dr00018388 [Drosera rotundifolia]